MNSGRQKPKMQGKTSSHRDAVLRSLLIELVRNGKLQTTPNRAKLLKAGFDKVVTEAKKGTPASRRRVEVMLNEKSAVKLYAKIMPQLSKDNSGYTLSARTLPRKGDNAEQMIVMIKGTQLEERRSRLSTALEKRDQAEAAESQKGIRGRIKNIGGGVMPGRGQKQDSMKDTRRVSTS